MGWWCRLGDLRAMSETARDQANLQMLRRYIFNFDFIEPDTSMQQSWDCT